MSALNVNTKFFRLSGIATPSGICVVVLTKDTREIFQAEAVSKSVVVGVVGVVVVVVPLLFVGDVDDLPQPEKQGTDNAANRSSVLML